MGQPPLPPAPTPLSQIIAQQIKRAHELADLLNAALISNYNRDKANTIQWNQTNPPDMPPHPLPKPPMVVAVNEAGVAAGETADSLDLKDVFILIQYVDPVPPPTVPDVGTITLDLEHPIFPGGFRILTGNWHYLPVHSRIEYPPGSGNHYSLELNPMLGAYFQQIPPA